MPALHYNIEVGGQVQGVNFRSNCRKKATELGLAGFVQNLPNGLVYLEVEGDVEKIKDFLKALREGFGYIENVVLKSELGEVKGLADFRIKF